MILETTTFVWTAALQRSRNHGCCALGRFEITCLERRQHLIVRALSACPYDSKRCELIWTALSPSWPTTRPRYDDERFMSQSNDRPLPARCQACGTILPADSICCVQCGQIHNEQGLAELKERCEVLNRATGLRERCAVPTRQAC